MVNSRASLDSTFSALADGTRRAILARLALGEASVSELARPFPVSLPAISKHVRVLEAAGMVRRWKIGREHRCAIEPAAMREASTWLDEYRRFWEMRLDTLQTYLERDSPKTGTESTAGMEETLVRKSHRQEKRRKR